VYVFNFIELLMFFLSIIRMGYGQSFYYLNNLCNYFLLHYILNIVNKYKQQSGIEIIFNINFIHY